MQATRRLRRIRRSLARKKGFLCLILVLCSLGGVYRGAIAYLEAHARKVEAISKAAQHVSMEREPGRYMELSRQQTLAQLEPWFVALFALIPTSLVLIAIVFIIASPGRKTRARTPEQDWVVSMREGAVEYRQTH